MDTVLFGNAARFDRETTIARVTTYATRFYHDVVPDKEIARWSEEAVNAIWGEGVRVAAFVPMLALRDVREHVRDAVNLELDHPEI